MASNQGMLQVVSTDGSSGGPSLSDDQTSLSTSNTALLKKAFPNSPQFTSEPPKTVIDGEEVVLDRQDYRDFYVSKVLGGNNSKYLHYFGSPVDRDYSSSPDVSDLGASPAGEAANQGAPGSTIVKSGLGPNVNVAAAQDLIGLAGVSVGGYSFVGAHKVVDPNESSISFTPFVGDGSASPKTTSEKISSRNNIHGTSIPGTAIEASGE